MDEPFGPRQIRRPAFEDVPEARRRMMRAVGPKDTKPEMAVRRLLHQAGYRFRLHRRDLPGRPDIVFPSRRKVIEIRGCFWHRHPDPACRNAVMPRTRRDWWKEKLDSNVERDRRNVAMLEDLGWEVLVLWECEAKGGDLMRRMQFFLGPARVAKVPGPK